MSSLTLELEQALPHLDARTKTFVERVIREAIDLAKANDDHSAPQQLDANGYPPGYFESTFGSFAGEPLERASQGSYASREDW